jgi:hypothetical protein
MLPCAGFRGRGGAETLPCVGFWPPAGGGNAALRSVFAPGQRRNDALRRVFATSDDLRGAENAAGAAVSRAPFAANAGRGRGSGGRPLAGAGDLLRGQGLPGRFDWQA